MSRAASFSVVFLAKYPASRGLGQDGRIRLDDLLQGGGIDLTIDFTGVEVMNISFADEFLGKFLTSNDFSAAGCTVKVAGLNADNRYSVEVCVERREAQVVVLNEDGSLSLVGDQILADTFDTARELGGFKANDLAEVMGLSAQNANNRLKRLCQAGALRKAQVMGSTRGGREFIYEVLPAAVPDVDHLSPA